MTAAFVTPPVLAAARRVGSPPLDPRRRAGEHGAGRATPMTEAEWLGGDRHGRMLAHVGEKAGARKLRLFACACCRRHWGLFADRRSRAAVEALERAADGGRGAGGGRGIFRPWRPLNPGRSAVRPRPAGATGP